MLWASDQPKAMNYYNKINKPNTQKATTLMGFEPTISVCRDRKPTP